MRNLKVDLEAVRRRLRREAPITDAPSMRRPPVAYKRHPRSWRERTRRAALKRFSLRRRHSPKQPSTAGVSLFYENIGHA